MFRLLFLLTVSCYSVTDTSLFGLGANKEACYGDDFIMPLHEVGYSGRNVFFTPANGGEKIQVLLANGTSLDPHYGISSYQFTIREVTERDEGEFSTEFYTMTEHGLLFKALTLKIKDCSTRWTRDYGSNYYFRVPNTAYSLEFTPLKSANDPPPAPVLLWNRTGNTRASEGGVRGKLVNKEWRMEQLTPEYNGYYTFRNKKHKVISRDRLTVEAQTHYLSKQEGQDLQIDFHMEKLDPEQFDLMFYRTDDPEPVLLMKAGNVRTEWELHGTGLAGRIQVDAGFHLPPLQIIMEDVRPSDSGHFKLIDQKGNPALIVELYVQAAEIDPPYSEYVGMAIGISLVAVICCCCVKKCCCKKTTRNNDFVRQTEAAPAVYHYDDNTQPSSSALPTSSYGPTDSYPLCPTEPGSTYHQPLVPGPENLHVSSSQPEVVASTASHEPAPTAFLGVDADAEPQFELKGMMFPSALPLSSKTSYKDVYSSDKLNFL